MPFIPDSYSRVLEIGCGSGNFRKNFSSNIEYWGIEPDHDAANMARKIYSTVLTGTYETSSDKIPKNYFDLVICNDVIEHMPDHHLFLKDIHNKMTVNGYLVGSIPNVRYVDNLVNILYKKDWAYTDAGILDYTHQRFFTEKSLVRALRECNWQIEKLYGINPYPTATRSLRKWPRRKFWDLLIRCLGSDTRFLQFGFRCKKMIG